jgi:DNA-binding beta-propeller fold protein YncE
VAARPRILRAACAGSLACLLLLSLAACTSKTSDAAAHAGSGKATGGARHAPTSSSHGTPVSADGPAGSPGRVTAAAAPFSTPLTGPHLQPGSDPSVLPGPILIADRNNNRLIVVNPEGQITWEWPQPGDLAPGQTFLQPDDAFFTADGKEIVATQESDFVITVIDVATRKIVYRYGTPGVPGMGPNQVWNPDDAMMLPDGYIITADIKNCRILLIAPGAHVPARIYGTSTNYCYHDPPAHWGSPNGAFPMTNGHFLITEINGDWVDELGLNGQVYNEIHPPGEAYPSDSNEVSPGVYVSVSYTNPGVLETFNAKGQLLWRYHPVDGAPQLNEPSLALPLPNGDFLMNDDYNHRVVVIDPGTDKVVWQYGHTGQPGSAPGYLDKPDGVDLVPPYSLMMRHAATVGMP